MCVTRGQMPARGSEPALRAPATSCRPGTEQGPGAPPCSLLDPCAAWRASAVALARHLGRSQARPASCSRSNTRVGEESGQTLPGTGRLRFHVGDMGVLWPHQNPPTAPLRGPTPGGGAFRSLRCETWVLSCSVPFPTGTSLGWRRGAAGRARAPRGTPLPGDPSKLSSAVRRRNESSHECF